MTVFKSINPFNQEIVGEYPVFNEIQIDAALNKAALMYPDWRSTPISKRAELLIQLAAVLRNNAEIYATHISLEMGKVYAEARAEIEKCAGACIFYAENGPQMLRDRVIESDASKSLVAYDPIGAVFAVMPWNFPFWQVIRFAAPTLLAGNVALLKHASNVSQCAIDIEEAFLLAGFPEGVFQTLILESKNSEKVIAHPIVQGVTLTGSEQAGSAVAALAGKHIKKSVMELGGSDPFIVLDDADIHLAALAATKSRMQNAGQSCIAAKRFIVTEKIAPDFLQAFKNEIEKIKQGNPLVEGTTMGPVSSVRAAEELEQQQLTSIKKGATVITGASRNGANYAPTIISNVSEGMPAFSEEMFGPVASVITVKNPEAAIQIANVHRYGLGATIFSRDTDKAYHYARQIDSGAVFINAMVKSDARLPFGGVKKSGYGRELADYGLKEFTNVKTIYIA